jgi:hypothetical protein
MDSKSVMSMRSMDDASHDGSKSVLLKRNDRMPCSISFAR